MEKIVCDMLPKEKEVFEKYLNLGGNYLEFGMGGSTLLACQNENIKKIVSIESNKDWYDRIRIDHDFLKANNEGKIELCFVDIPFKYDKGIGWHPIDESATDKFPEYSEKIFETNLPKQNLILIDGRFRVACAIKCLLNLEFDYMIVHDFWNRKEYHKLLDILDVVEKQDSLVVFKKQENVGKVGMKNMLHILYLQYNLDWR